MKKRFMMFAVPAIVFFAAVSLLVSFATKAWGAELALSYYTHEASRTVLCGPPTEAIYDPPRVACMEMDGTNLQNFPSVTCKEGGDIELAGHRVTIPESFNFDRVAPMMDRPARTAATEVTVRSVVFCARPNQPWY